MKILFSPSETKTSGGDGKPINKNSFIFEKLYEKRLSVVKLYQDFLDRASIDEKKKLFGIKDISQIDNFSSSIFDKNTKKAILRYSGVAFDYLEYDLIDIKSKEYIDKNVILFSNIFGPISPKDEIPEYKLKQGEKIGSVNIEKFYEENFSKVLDEYLKDEDILDLRAGFYEKFYKIKTPYTTMKFIKDGKVVSHWAKAYRGIILKSLAQNNIQTINQLMDLEIPSLSIEEIKKIKNKSEIVYSIQEN